MLSADDPVQVFQQFATLDLLSQGRAELVVGRGSAAADWWVWRTATGRPQSN